MRTFAISIVTLNVPDTTDATSGELTVTGTPTVTSESNQSAGVSFAPVSAICPADMSRMLTSPTSPNTSKLIVASNPDPLTPPMLLRSTWIVSASAKFHASIGTVVPSMLPL